MRVIGWGLLLALAFLVWEIGPSLWLYRQRQIAIEECRQGDCRMWDSLARRDYR